MIRMTKLEAGSIVLTTTPFPHADNQEIIMKVPNGFPESTLLLVNFRHSSRKEPILKAPVLGLTPSKEMSVSRHHSDVPWPH